MPTRKRGIDRQPGPADAGDLGAFRYIRVIGRDVYKRQVIQHPYTERVIHIARSDLLTWCEQKEISPSLLPVGTNVPKQLDQNDPVDYRTPALDALRAAISHFWLNHDPKRPPKSPEIVDWLIQQHGITKAMAESIDRIIRPETHRKGGNVTLN